MKELLLRYHNFTVYKAFEAMKQQKVRAYSVKSAAFTIHSDDLHKVAGYKYLSRWIDGCLDVENKIGQWRIEEDKRINFRTEPYELKFQT